MADVNNHIPISSQSTHPSVQIASNPVKTTAAQNKPQQLTVYPEKSATARAAELALRILVGIVCAAAVAVGILTFCATIHIALPIAIAAFITGLLGNQVLELGFFIHQKIQEAKAKKLMKPPVPIKPPVPPVPPTPPITNQGTGGNGQTSTSPTPPDNSSNIVTNPTDPNTNPIITNPTDPNTNPIVTNPTDPNTTSTDPKKDPNITPPGGATITPPPGDRPDTPSTNTSTEPDDAVKKRQIEEDAKRKQLEDDAKLKELEENAKKQLEDDAKKKELEENAKKKQLEEDAKKQLEADTKKQTEADTKKKDSEEDVKKLEEKLKNLNTPDAVKESVDTIIANREYTEKARLTKQFADLRHLLKEGNLIEFGHVTRLDDKIGEVSNCLETLNDDHLRFTYSPAIEQAKIHAHDLRTKAFFAMEKALVSSIMDLDLERLEKTIERLNREDVLWHAEKVYQAPENLEEFKQMCKDAEEIIRTLKEWGGKYSELTTALSGKNFVEARNAQQALSTLKPTITFLENKVRGLQSKEFSIFGADNISGRESFEKRVDGIWTNYTEAVELVDTTGAFLEDILDTDASICKLDLSLEAMIKDEKSETTLEEMLKEIDALVIRLNKYQDEELLPIRETYKSGLNSLKEDVMKRMAPANNQISINHVEASATQSVVPNIKINLPQNDNTVINVTTTIIPPSPTGSEISTVSSAESVAPEAPPATDIPADLPSVQHKPLVLHPPSAKKKPLHRGNTLIKLVEKEVNQRHDVMIGKVVTPSPLAVVGPNVNPPGTPQPQKKFQFQKPSAETAAKLAAAANAPRPGSAPVLGVPNKEERVKDTGAQKKDDAANKKDANANKTPAATGGDRSKTPTPSATGLDGALSHAAAFALKNPVKVGSAVEHSIADCPDDWDDEANNKTAAAKPASKPVPATNSKPVASSSSAAPGTPFLTVPASVKKSAAPATNTVIVPSKPAVTPAKPAVGNNVAKLAALLNNNK